MNPKFAMAFVVSALWLTAAACGEEESTSCEVGGDVVCCADSDCTEGEICTDQNTCQPVEVTCSVGGDIACCEDSDCAAGETCTDANLCLAPTPSCTAGAGIACCEDSDCAEGETCLEAGTESSSCEAPAPTCTVGGDVQCCDDTDCNAGESCVVTSSATDASICEVPCAVGGDIQCCDVNDCNAGESCTAGNVCEVPCAIGGAVECCSDTDCATGELCNDTSVCETPVADPINQCGACDPSDDLCGDGLFCNTYMDAATGAAYNGCAPAATPGTTVACDAAAWDGTGCDASNVGAVCSMTGIGGSIEVHCGCNAQWDVLQASNAPQALAQCDQCDPANDTCDAGLYCSTYMDAATGGSYNACAPAATPGTTAACDAAAWDGTGCDASNVGAVCSMTGIGGSIEVHCGCNAQWDVLQASNAPQPLAQCDQCDPANDQCGTGQSCYSYMDGNTGATYNECGPAHYPGSQATCDAAAFDYSGCDASTVGATCAFVGIGGAMDLHCSCSGGWSLAM